MNNVVDTDNIASPFCEHYILFLYFKYIKFSFFVFLSRNKPLRNGLTDTYKIFCVYSVGRRISTNLFFERYRCGRVAQLGELKLL